ncbi:MAG: CidA/LrgA family protein [Eubacteriales bacterium]|nr:CidA/LrgA family protein [Eubacteriales bacterium]
MTYLKQLAVLLACCAAGEALSLLLGGRLPGNVLGLALLLVLLLTGVIRPRHIEGAADFLLQNMAFFCLPLGLSVLDIFDQIKGEVLAIFAVCVLTTLCTAAATALTVRLVCAVQRRMRGEVSDRA